MNFLRLFFSLFVFGSAGWLALVFFNHRRKAQFHVLEAAAFSWMAGMGLLSLQMFLYALGHIPFTPIAIALPWVIGNALLPVFPSFRKLMAGMIRFRAASNNGPRWPGVVFLLLAGAQIAFAFIASSSLPVSGWDAWASWFFRGRVFFLSHGLPPAFFTDPALPIHIQADYPLMIPLSITWVYTCLGHVDDQAVKILWALQYFSLTVLFYYFAKELSSRMQAYFFTVLLVLVPILMIHGGGLSPNLKFAGLYSSNFVGYADLALAAYFLAAGGFLALGIVRRHGACLAASVFFAGLAAWTKNEGLSFALAVAAVIGGYAIQCRLTSRKNIFLILTLLVSLLLPWILYKKSLNLSNEYVGQINFQAIGSRIPDLPGIVIRILGRMFRDFGLYNGTWYFYVLFLFRNRRNLLSPASWSLNLLFFFQFGSYVLIYLITPRDLEWHLGTSLDRLVLHLIPLALLITSVNSFQSNMPQTIPVRLRGKS